MDHWHTVGVTEIDLAAVSAELEAKEQRLRAQLGELTAPVADGATIGFGKRIGDGTTQAIQQFADASSARDLADLLDQVVRAQVKLEEGTWGRCDVCAEPTDSLRLQVRPWSVTCVTHAGQAGS